MTVADINRLEQAARVSMSGFQDPEAPPSASRHFHPLLHFTAVVLVAAVVLAAAWHLT
ncbi:hypothetical protein [Mesorhizobium amorphae]|uniref:Uncharacterized protein n=1 Tax=Mesorhizobium amorphae CCNWGS0123 TaxID=1082933 RepID=G6YDY3_9HYPH|nr:hypothetical protein [Mesorhizobium amorphae]EHH10056.1 hypothetical protein MEA186_20879 [Mesorhizobium amorphae CCNWGS0123]GLR41906.1 hypothetical protein GCM10007880_24220 [Mesorhizobium amorphae]